MEASDLVRTMLATTGLSASSVARRAGVSGSTLHRIANDQVDPSFGTMREIAIVCGQHLSLATTLLSDPLAASAARSMLEENYEPPEDPEVGHWKERLPRLAGSDDPVAIVQIAACASSPLHRAGGTLYTGAVPLARLASAGDATRKRWAISGAAGLHLPLEGDVVPAVTILWCEDVRSVEHLLVGSGLRAPQRDDQATIAVVAAEPELFAGSFTHGIARYAAPIQIMLDCIAQNGPLADRALEEIASW